METNVVTKEALLHILEFLDSLSIPYWVDGGWGVDILLGAQHREHRDLDIDFDAQATERLLEALRRRGYQVTTDWSPCRMELYHRELGYLDIHPLVINPDGSAKQADGSGGWYEFSAAWFTQAAFENRQVPCLTAEAQTLFHTGYELREKDRIDMRNLQRHLGKEE